MSDIRLDIGFLKHPKTKLLLRKLGADAVLALQALWLFAASERPDGRLEGMNCEFIALAADWDDDPEIFVDTLLALRFLDWIDEGDGTYLLHNWAKRNPWVSGAQARSDAAKKAADAGWKKRKGEDAPVAESSNAESCEPHKSAHAENASRIEPAMPLTLPILSLPNHTQPHQSAIAPEGDRRRGRDDGIFEVATVYQNNIGLLTALTAEKLTALTDEYTGAWVLEAITVAVEANARKLSYIEGVLKNWHVNGFKSAPPNHKARGKPEPVIEDFSAYERAMKGGSA